MKTYSNDPQDWTLEDAYSQEFDDTKWNDLFEDITNYFTYREYALESFKEWWIEQKIKEHPYKEFD
jgi:hypothetical protein